MAEHSTPASESLLLPSHVRVCTHERPCVLPIVRDVLLCIACLCVLVWTVMVMWVWASVGSALSEVGTPATPAPLDTTCVGELPC